MRNFNIHDAVRKRQIIPFSDGPKLVSKELRTAQEDLKEAKETLSRERFKWATTQAYYAMFHAYRALLYKKKYREKSHIQLGLAVKAFYIDQGLLPESYYDHFIQASDLRQMADYKRKFSKQGAERNIQAAEEVIRLAINLLKEKIKPKR